MANPEHVKVVRQGATAIAEWRRQNPETSLDLRGAELTFALLRDADLSKANLRGADLRGAYLLQANLLEADLVGADLGGADLAQARLADADLTKADLSWSTVIGADLSRVHMIGADVTGASLVRANLARADLAGADLFAANLLTADLRRTNLTGADLTAAQLFMAKLSRANLSKANLIGANFTRAELTKANLAEAMLGWTSLGNCSLSQVVGLSTVQHEGPSSVGVDTLIASFRGAGNKLTPDLETFFLGAGVPKELLERLPEIVGAVEYYSCFISYGQPDVDFARQLRDDLAARGVSCWLYDLDATPGERTWKEIGTVRREADRMVVVCSVKALLRDGVLKEIEEQIDEDPDKMVPISLDSIWTDPGFRVMRAAHDLTPWLRDRNYADFSDDARYEESLQRLLKALRRKAE